jgi:RNA polymerase sigma-70 factor (ECF subfamily)
VEAVPEAQQASREERFTVLTQVVTEPLRRYLLRRTDPDTAQDVLADTFLVLWRRLDDVPADDPLPWCYAVTRGCLANTMRAAARQRRLVARLTLLHPREMSGPMLDDADLYEALGRMSEGDQELVRLWAWERLTPQEIAVVLGGTANAASIRLHRARKKLASMLDDRNGRGSPGQEQVSERRPR